MKHLFALVSLAIVAAVALATLAGPAVASPTALPDPLVDTDGAKITGTQTAVFAGGCFWGVEGVFEHVKGVTQVVSGYAGGKADTATYDQVSTGTTGHAESVRVSYDPKRISYGQLLKIFFAVAHNPTELNRQGPDSGTQYRSAIFFGNEEQQKVATAYIAQLQKVHAFPAPIVTQVTPLSVFYDAEAYHQNYLALHPHQMYIVVNDLPKVANLKREFPALYVEK